MLAKLFEKPPSAGGPRTAPAVQRWLWQQKMVLLGPLLLLTGLWSAIFWQSGRDWREAELAAVQQLNTLSFAVAESTASKLLIADHLIRLVRDAALRKGAPYKIEHSAELAALFDESLIQIGIVDADGFLADFSLPFSRVYLGDREFFRVQQQAQDDQVFVSQALKSRVSGALVLQVTRRLVTPDGRFGGVAFVSLASDVFNSLYKHFDVGAQDVVTLAGTDGWIRTRQAVSGGAVDQNIRDSAVFQAALRAPVGVVWAVSPTDQIERLYAFRSLEKYGLIAFVARGRADIMSEVYQLRQIYIGGGVLFTLLLLGFMAALLRAMHRQSVLLEDLRLSNLEAGSAHEMKGRILASVSHELRTPLNGILGYAELMLEPATTGEIQEYAQIIYGSGQQLHQLVNTMLNLAQVESGRMSANLADSSLQEMLEVAGKPHRAAALSRQLTWQVSVDDRCPRLISTDRVRLLQVLDSLMHNAVKFTEHGGVAVAVYCDSLALTLEISDTGMGISAAQMKHLFARFEVPTPEFSHPAQGAGLGLPLAKELTQLIGGVLLIDSTLALGTRATIVLPLRSAGAVDTKVKTP